MRPRFLLLLAVLVASSPAPAQERGAFIVRLGRDTVVVESFLRAADRIQGRHISRAPETVVREYAATLAPDGTVRRVEWTTRGGGTTRRGSIEFSGDSALVETAEGVQRLAAPAGTLPFVSNSWALLELATRRHRSAAAISQPALTVGGSQIRTIALDRLGADSMTVTVIEGLPYRARVDDAGRVLGARWTGEWSVERLPQLDLEALAADFARRPLGALSPADSVQATVGGATLAVRYSRPAMRGRKIFGHIVPWNEVWRTGANEATLFSTTADLEVGGMTVPAGTYTLWTIPSPSGWTLVLNRNTGQWGTDYSAQYDLARLAMRVEPLTQPVERFTIAIEPRGAGAVVTLEWETTRAAIAVRPKP
jgi:hypothetical protein